MSRFRQLLVVSGLVAMFMMLLGTSIQGALHPTKGTFRGICHVNRAGVARMNFFIFSAELKTKLASHAGRYIEVEVLKADQPTNPGPVYVEEIGTVVELPAPPLELKLAVRPSPAAGDGAFETTCSVLNRGSEAVTFDADTLQVGIQSYPGRPVRLVDPMPGLGYTGRQLVFGGAAPQVHNFLSPQIPGKSTTFYTRWVSLRPGEAATDPGTYKDLNGKVHRKLDGTLVSNMVEFEVLPAE